MIALGLAGGHDQIVTLGLCIMKQVFQFPDLIAAQSNTAQVIPLDPNIGPQFPADVRQTVQRGREESQGLFFKMFHGVLPS